jgi:CRISPR/Cas system-associated exonuclease Cas4 (RecB family)
MKCLDLDSGFVIYENKNNQEILPIYMERDDKFIEKLYTKYNKIHKSFLDDVLPVRPYKSIGSKQCVSCNAKDFCWADPDLGQRI